MSKSHDQPAPEDTGEIPASTDATTLQAQLEAAQADAAKFKEHYLRAMADLDNFRRRSIRDKEDVLRLATAAVMQDLVPVLDNLRLGLQSALQAHPEAKAVIDGFKLVSDQLRSVLAEHGLQEIDPLGQPFDAKFHEAVAQQPNNEVAEGHVLQVLRPGYLLNERLLRAATVTVSSGPKE
jgi:molecular chaperone GrpE